MRRDDEIKIFQRIVEIFVNNVSFLFPGPEAGKAEKLHIGLKSTFVRIVFFHGRLAFGKSVENPSVLVHFLHYKNSEFFFKYFPEFFEKIFGISEKEILSGFLRSLPFKSLFLQKKYLKERKTEKQGKMAKMESFCFEKTRRRSDEKLKKTDFEEKND